MTTCPACGSTALADDDSCIFCANREAIKRELEQAWRVPVGGVHVETNVMLDGKALVKRRWWRR